MELKYLIGQSFLPDYKYNMAKQEQNEINKLPNDHHRDIQINRFKEVKSLTKQSTQRQAELKEEVIDLYSKTTESFLYDYQGTSVTTKTKKEIKKI
jgi:hypothetical protein